MTVKDSTARPAGNSTRLSAGCTPPMSIGRCRLGSCRLQAAPLEYNYLVIFIETTLFTRLLPDYFSDDEYRLLQAFLMDYPEAGDVIPATGGLRKLRWAAKGRGKRGDLRVIYYRWPKRRRFYLLTVYAKNEASDLSATERKALSLLVEQWKNEQT